MFAYSCCYAAHSIALMPHISNYTKKTLLKTIHVINLIIIVVYWKSNYSAFHDETFIRNQPLT